MAGNNSIQFLRGTSSARASHSELSLAGQPLFETDTNKLYVGDGNKKINELTTISVDASSIDGVLSPANGGTGSQTSKSNLPKDINTLYGRRIDDDNVEDGLEGVDENWLLTHSFIGSTMQDGSWGTIFNIRHRNGTGDGSRYGTQLFTIWQGGTSSYPLDKLMYRNQRSDVWANWKTLATEDWVSTNFLSKEDASTPTVTNNSDGTVNIVFN